MYEPPYPKLTVRQYIFFRIEYTADFQRHSGFFIRLRYILQFLDYRTVCHTDTDHGLHIQCIRDNLCSLVHIFVIFCLLQRLHKNNMSLIHGRHKVSAAGGVQPL